MWKRIQYFYYNIDGRRMAGIWSVSNWKWLCEKSDAPVLIGGKSGERYTKLLLERKYLKSEYAILAIAAILGDDGIGSLATMGERFGNRDLHLWYLAGVAAGFFLYAVYVLLVAIFANRGKIQDKELFDRKPFREGDGG